MNNSKYEIEAILCTVYFGGVQSGSPVGKYIGFFWKKQIGQDTSVFRISFMTIRRADKASISVSHFKLNISNFFIHFQQRDECASAIILEGYYTYFWHGVRYNGIADEVKPLTSHERRRSQSALMIRITVPKKSKINSKNNHVNCEALSGIDNATLEITCRARRR